MSRSKASPHAGRLLLVSLASCADEPTPTPLPEVVTPTPGPNIDHQTWITIYLEATDPLVYADTILYFGTEHQNGTELIAYIFHYDGPLIIDGYEVPEGKAMPLTGTYLWERELDVSAEYYGHVLRVPLQLNAEGFWMQGRMQYRSVKRPATGKRPHPALRATLSRKREKVRALKFLCFALSCLRERAAQRAG